MTAFPSGSGNHIPTDNLNQSTDKPKDAREDLLELAQRMNTIIDSFNANNGICGLTSGGKVDSAKLIGQIDTAQLVGDAVTGDKIEDDAIDSEHINNGAVDKVHCSFISQATIDGTATNNVVPTQLAVKTLVDTSISNAPSTPTQTVIKWRNPSSNDHASGEVYIPTGYKATSAKIWGNRLTFELFLDRIDASASTVNLGSVSTALKVNQGVGEMTLDFTDVNATEVNYLRFSTSNYNGFDDRFFGFIIYLSVI